MKRCMHCMMQYDEKLTECPQCGHKEGIMPAVSYYLEPGAVLKDRYIIGEVIGSGGFGITYIGWDKMLNLKIAIKEYYPNGVVSRENSSRRVSLTGSTTEEFYQKGLNTFLAEARTISSFNELSNIVHIYNYLEENNTAYIIMEFIEGETLEEYLKKHDGGFLPWEEAIKITDGVLATLEKIHSKGVIHRDISPSNIMITIDGRVKLLDFGAARHFVAGRTQEMSVIIKRGYAPIEQYKSDAKQDERSDIYSLGAVLYRMLTGHVPEETLNRISEDKLERPRDINNDIPVWLEIIVTRAMSVNPYERYATAHMFRKELNSGKEKGKKWKTMIAVLVFVLISTIVAVTLILGKQANETVEQQKANYYIDLPETIDLHTNEQFNCPVTISKLDITVDSKVDYNYEITAELSDKEIAKVEVDNNLHDIKIHGKNIGKAKLTIKTPYVSKEININVKEKEETYPDGNVSKAILEVGKDIPEGEYVAFAKSCYAHFDVLKQEPEPNSSLDDNNVYFDYNCYVFLSDGEAIEIEDAYLVPADKAKIDTSAEGVFKVGKDIKEGVYKIVFDKDFTYSYVMHSTHTMIPSFFEHGKRVQYVYLSENGFKYIFIKDGHLEKCDKKYKDNEIITEKWTLSKSLVNGKLYYDYYFDQKAKGAEDIDREIKGNQELVNVLNTLPLFDISITIYRDGSAEFAIPSGYVKKTDEEISSSSLGKGEIKKNEDGTYTYTIIKPDCIERQNPQTINQKGSKFKYEITSDTELRFYYDYYNMVLIFER